MLELWKLSHGYMYVDSVRLQAHQPRSQGGWWPRDEPIADVFVSDSHSDYISLPVRLLQAMPELAQCGECLVYSLEMRANDFCECCATKKHPEVQLFKYNTNVALNLAAHTKISPKALTANKPLLGCELEYQCPPKDSTRSRVELMAHLKEFALFKVDASLAAGGFEVVTRPAEASEHYATFKPVFTNFPKPLYRNEKTGMHVHVDRKALSPLLLARMVDFMHNGENKEFIELVAERALNNYCNQDISRSFGYILSHGDNDRNDSRSVTLNLCKEATVEFRIFLTPLTYPTFCKNVEFVTELINYLRTGTLLLTPKQTRHWNRFATYIKDNNHSRKVERNQSEHLATFLKDKGAI